MRSRLTRRFGPPENSCDSILESRNVKGIEQQIEVSVVGPIFARIRNNGHMDQSLPDIVLDNRRSRAYRRILDALKSRGSAIIPAEMHKRLESIVEAWSHQAFDDAF